MIHAFLIVLLPLDADIIPFSVSRSRLAKPQIKHFMLAARCEYSTLLSTLPSFRMVTMFWSLVSAESHLNRPTQSRYDLLCSSH